jgi:hypothetical protein
VILTDGRKLTAIFQSKEAWHASLGDLRIPGKKTNKEASSCETTLKLHGLLTRAQFQCNYRSYNKELIDKAAACAAGFPDPKVKELFENGMKMFDQIETEHGHRKVCGDILRDFPMFVRK